MMMTPKYHLDLAFLKKPLEFDLISILQIGKMHCKPNNTVTSHIHPDYYELTVITNGSGKIVTNGVKIPVKQGDIYLSLPCDSHEIISDAETPLKFYFYSFILKPGEYKEQLDNISANYYAATERIINDNYIETIIGNVISELNNEVIYSKELISMYLREIVIRIIRNFKQITPKAQHSFTTDNEALCYSIMNYIDTHIYSMKNLNELSSALGYSYSYLSTVYKKITGNTISDYYSDKKLEIARHLVLENRLKITKISELLNYNSAYAFSKAFKNRYSYSPKIFRELEQNKSTQH